MTTKKIQKIANFTNGPFAWLSCNLSYLWFFHGSTEVLTIKLVLPQFKQFTCSDPVLERKKYNTCISFGALSYFTWFIISINSLYEYCSWNAQQKAVHTWMSERRGVFFSFCMCYIFLFLFRSGHFLLYISTWKLGKSV